MDVIVFVFQFLSHSPTASGARNPGSTAPLFSAHGAMFPKPKTRASRAQSSGSHYIHARSGAPGYGKTEVGTTIIFCPMNE